MDKIVFKYDIMNIYEDKYSFKRFKKKPFFRLLSDIFISRTSCIRSTGLILMFLLVALTLRLAHRPVVIGNFLPVLFACIFISYLVPLIELYREQHKNVTVSISNIEELCMSKDKKTLRIKYFNGNRYAVKIIDMPDADDENQCVIEQLNEISNQFNQLQNGI